MSIDRHKEIVRELYAVSTGTLEDWLGAHERHFAPSEVLHLPGQEPLDWQGHHDLDHQLYAAFTDFRLDLEDLVAEGDRVVARFSFGGVHTGEYHGIPPSGNTIRSSGVAIYRFENELIVEEWYQSDQLSILSGMGAM
jgi:predicted ester cyclase